MRTNIGAEAQWAYAPADMHWSGRSEWVQQPQQERSQAGMVAVLECATRLFARHGFENTTIAMISRDSGTSTAAIYRRFSDKSAILRAIVDHWSSAWMNDFERIWQSANLASASPQDIIRFHIEILFSAFRSDPGLLREIDRQCNYDPAVAGIMAVMDRRSAEALLAALAEASGTAPEILHPGIVRVTWIVRSTLGMAVQREQLGLWPPFTIHDDALKDILVDMAFAVLMPSCG